jgi:SAM-dependent methyltransferase
MSESNIFELVGKHYDEAGFQMELDRLPIAAPVEMHITLRYLARYVPDGARVCEIGVGGGIYSLALAQRGCALHFVDVSRRLLEYVEKKIREAGFGSQIVGSTYASATDLAAINSAQFEVVLLLGPLYHLLTDADRRSAVAESRRLLKSGGLLFAAGINRISAFRDLFRDFSKIPFVTPEMATEWEIIRRRWIDAGCAPGSFLDGYLRDGNVNPEYAPPIGYAHVATVEQFRALFGAFNEITLAGVESFTAPWQYRLNELPEAERKLWLDLVETTSTTAEGLAYSDHFLYIGRAN